MSRTKNTANQPPSSNQNLRKTYDDLVADHTIVPHILFSPTTPTRALRDPTRSSRRLALGPAICKNFPEQLSPLFPDNIALRPAYQKQNIEWGEWSSLVCKIATTMIEILQLRKSTRVDLLLLKLSWRMHIKIVNR